MGKVKVVSKNNQVSVKVKSTKDEQLNQNMAELLSNTAVEGFLPFHIVSDNNGFTDVVTMTVTDGKITEVNWDAVGADGSTKSVLSENGEYVMTEDGLTWKEQAEALANALIENQSLDFLQVNEQGKTDAVSGVSISVGGFISLAEKCMNEAAGIEETEEVPANGTQVDAVSGATISSTAVVTGINKAFELLQTVK